MNPSSQLSLMKAVGYSGKTPASTYPAPSTYQSQGFALKPSQPSTAGLVPGSDPYAYQKQQLAQGQALIDQIRALGAPQPLQYSNFDIAGNSARARAAAENAVNPLYTKKLNDFLGQQRTAQARQQADTQTANNQLQEALTNTLEANAITKQRTGEDVTQNLSNIADQSQQYQQDTGTQFDQARLALLRGTQDTGGGLGAQAVANQQGQRNITEGRQGQQFQQQAQQQRLAQSRTFEDLARSGTLATKQTGEGKTANNLSLQRYIEDNGVGQGKDLASIIANSGTNVKSQANTYELQRLGDILSQQQQYESTGFKQFLSTLRGQNLANTAQVYGGIF